ncbi:MAG: hypothetical protein ACRD0P_35190 [Stackebrandtia sp.]
MQLGTSRNTRRLRNRLIVSGLAALAGGTAWAAAARRPQLPLPAAEPPRLGQATGVDPAAVTAQ